MSIKQNDDFENKGAVILCQKQIDGASTPKLCHNQVKGSPYPQQSIIL